MAQAKELFINGVRQVSVHGNTTVPTVVRYHGGKALVGVEALQGCEHPSQRREDFKVEIGNEDPLKLAQRPAEGSSSSGRSVLGIAKDFTDYIVGVALNKIDEGSAKPTKILVAEPLALATASGSEDRWLQNYRQSLRRMLSGKFEEVDFMPEPFAVFQYYRYGVRHALVAQKEQNIALVIDFGGGTFDTCVIQTTKAGDISQSGRNSKPLAARSISVGGFEVNRLIAQELLFEIVGKGYDRMQLNSALKDYKRLKNLDDQTLALEKLSAFTRNYHRLLHSVEQAKCVVSNGMPSWRLDADLSSAGGCTVEVPTRPFEEGSPITSLRLDGALLRKIFEEKVWRPHLLPAVKDTIQRAAAELGNRPITVVLLSGGSSNIRWLKPLLERDVASALREAEVLELSENFQEIVAKGLAVECARRFYTGGDGDFRAVTYNRLCLGLDPNGQGLEFKKYTPEDKELRDIEADQGVLMPSATFLKKFIGRPMRWKVRLTNLPSRNLNYYFMRSSFDTEDMKSRQNIDCRLVTPPNVSMGGPIGVELLVREDGTAEPSFRYGHGERDGRMTAVKGKAFYLDMTFATEEVAGTSYMGLDFGTSTSSICYVNESDIRTYKSRSTDTTWRSLSSLVETLPYPAARPLAQLVSATSEERIARASREAMEGMLSMAVYTAFAEHCAVTNSRTRYFKGLEQCSAGPLWRTFKDMAAATGRRWTICKDLLPLVSASSLAEIEHAVTQVAPEKHGKKSDGVDWPRTLEQFGNALAKVFDGRVFGYFDTASRKAFRRDRYTGMFRCARGPSAALNDIFVFEGPESFPREFVFVFDLGSKTGLCLSPLIVRGLEASGAQYVEPDFFLFDIAKKGEFCFKAVQEREGVWLKTGGPFAELNDEVTKLMTVDPQLELIRDFEFAPRTLA